MSTHKHVGLNFLNFLNNRHWAFDIDGRVRKASSRLQIIRKHNYELNCKSLETLYFSYIRPILEYAYVIWDNTTAELAQKVEQINIESARIITGATKLSIMQDLYKETRWETLQTRRRNHKILQHHKIIHSLAPPYLTSLISPRGIDTHN